MMDGYCGKKDAFCGGGVLSIDCPNGNTITVMM
jgi:hypothetical protein